jgi:hypothetical protein
MSSTVADTNDGSLSRLSYNKETDWFKAAAFVPSATINACWNIWKFVALMHAIQSQGI